MSECAGRVPRAFSLWNLNKRNWMQVDPDAPNKGVKEKADPYWVYGYDATSAPLQETYAASRCFGVRRDDPVHDRKTPTHKGLCTGPEPSTSVFQCGESRNEALKL